MCASCGCSEGAWHFGEEKGEKAPAPERKAQRDRRERDHRHDHEHHGPGHGHDHHHDPERDPAGDPRHEHEHPRAAPLRSDPALLPLEIDLLAKNDRLAAANRARLEQAGITAINLIGAPGAGKTALLEATIRRLGHLPLAVIEGDQETDADAARIRAAGCNVLQINTGAGCHLDASMVERALDRLDLPTGTLLFVENVGNLVCPALFDLGERARVVVASVTEGEDKPLKYPHVFRSADALLLNKIDLVPHLDFDVDHFLAHARQIRPGLRIFPVSARTGAGLDDWCGWLAGGLR